jgi:hypothetical protein
LSRRHKRRKPGVCVYCGRKALLTVDHIPPKALYPSGLWSQLLKIPSCLVCNGGASKDDEYLRTIIGLSAKGERDEILKPVSDAAVRSLVRPEATGFRASILNGITEMFVSGTEGIFRPALVGSVDLKRFDRVVARIIKGVFFFERGFPLPANYRVVNYSTDGLKKVPLRLGLQLKGFIEDVIVGEPKHIGGPQFVYWSHYNPDDLNQSKWILVLHRHHFFIGWTVKACDGMVCNDDPTVGYIDEAKD